MKTAILVYTAAHVEELPSLLTQYDKVETEIIAFGIPIELLLKEKDIPFRSIREYRTYKTPERLAFREKLGREFLNHESMSFFSHKGIHLGALYTPALQYYLENFLYYLDIVHHLLKNSYDEILLFGVIREAGPTSSILESLNNRCVFDAASLVAKAENISLNTQFLRIEEGGTLGDKIRWGFFGFKRELFSLALWGFNLAIEHTLPRKSIRVLGSEYWKNISPLMKELKESELILLDRAQVRKIGRKNIFKYRMQFMHGEDFATPKMQIIAGIEAERYEETWKRVQNLNPHLHEKFLGHNLRPILLRAFGRLLRASEKTVAEIEGTYTMLKKMKPDVVIVRASISAQTHFALLCEVARHLKIPSIEIQHGIFSMGKEVLTWDHAAEYIAGYGPLDKKIWSENEYAPRSTVIPVGSPRFDAYVAKGQRVDLQNGKFNIVLIGPQVGAGDWIDTYDLEDHFKMIAKAISHIPHAHLTIKLRAGDDKKLFFKKTIEEAFGGASYEVIADSPLHKVLPGADAVISCHSTAALEALLVGAPIILDATIDMHALLVPRDFSLHEKEGALRIARSPVELEQELKRLASSKREREELSKRAKEFMKEQYLFADGKSSERLAQAIKNIIRQDS